MKITSNYKLVSQSAESNIYLVKNFSQFYPSVICKHRISKKYRIKELEDKLQKKRMKQEIQNMKKAIVNKIGVPYLIHIKIKENAIFMEYLENYQTLTKILKNQNLEQNKIKNFSSKLF